MASITYTVDESVESWNSKVDITPASPVNYSGNVVIKVTPKSGYHFASDDVCYFLDADYQQFNFNLQSDGTMTFSLDEDYDGASFTMNFTITEDDVKPTTYTITYTVDESLKNWNDEITITPSSPIEIKDGEEITIKVTPKDGYYFSNNDLCYFQSEGESDYFTLQKDGTMVHIVTKEYARNNTLFYTITKGSPAIVIRPNFYTIYAPTADNMKKINDSIFIGSSGDIGIVDKFISYKKFWCNIPTDGTAILKAGNYSFAVSAPVVHKTIVDIDCGSVNVVGLYHSLVDYAPFSRLTIYLPFIGFVDLDDKFAMNNSVRVNYRVDVLSGRCLAEIFTKIDNDNESCIATYTGTIASDEPLSQGQVNYRGSYEILTSMQLGELTPFILVNTKVPLDNGNTNLDGLPVDEVKKVGDCSGFTRYSFINASGCSGTDSEKTEIEYLLKNGINIS